MSKSISVIIPEKTDAYSRVKRFLSNEESGIVLNSKEEEMLTRWIYANALLKEKKFRSEQVIEKIREKFSVSVHTARMDISRAYSLFSSVTDDYKRYMLREHVEDIDQMIQQWKTDKSLLPYLPKLMAEKTKAIMAIPVEVQAPDVPAPIIIVNTTTGLKATKDLSEALEEADKLIEFEKNHDYAEFEDVPDEPAER